MFLINKLIYEKLLFSILLIYKINIELKIIYKIYN